MLCQIYATSRLLIYTTSLSFLIHIYDNYDLVPLSAPPPILHALNGIACSFNAAGLIYVQNVIAPINTQIIFVM
jgi:hypothetical protein